MSSGEENLNTSEVARREENILEFWKQNDTYHKALEKKAPKGEFVFYDGPPFATGLPHSGSMLSSVCKDVLPRYKTMRGYRVRRRWGWDTHGLPIESLVEKELGLKNKKEILALGIETFNEKARSMVLEYVNDWKRYVERVGRWVDFDNSYKTMDATFTESVWWGLKQIYNKGNLYEGRKVLMYCPHCETPLAKAEIAMDNTYKDITEEAVTVKFRIMMEGQTLGLNLPDESYLLAWTTTPWTLPGNVALAVNTELEYGVYERDGVGYVMATARASQYGFTEAKTTWPGSRLRGVRYIPLYTVDKVATHAGKHWEVLGASFVTADDGTGIVHTAVIYGEDDYQLGLANGLPMVPLLNANATYNQDAPEFLWGQYIKKAEPLIKDDLSGRSLLFARAPHTHSYPHCYRCGTPLIYNAVSSWFINIQAVKDCMIAENKSINWSPAHLKEGRFRNNLENAPDWTISRNRFWASPLPIWKDDTGAITVVGSLEELKAYTKKSGNHYVVMRHGEARNNAGGFLNSHTEVTCELTEKGAEQARATARSLKRQGIDRIYVSPFTRTQETARIVAQELGIDESRIITDERLRELDFGTLDGGMYEDFLAYEAEHIHAYDVPLPEGESYLEAKKRFGAFLYELERTISNERILIVSHGIALETLSAVCEGADMRRSKELIDAADYQLAETIELPFVPLPHNANYELDYHLPYIDRVELTTSEGKSLTRIPEVVDCWVESGSMPFAEYHYPFENKKEFEKRTPADFISEYIGQTRAWFYYMHAMGVSLFGHSAFRNVVTTGTVLAADGEKLSKSKRNYTDPYLLFDKYGADAFRYYLMSSVVMQAEDLVFRDDDVKDVHARVVNMLRNVASFYELYKDGLETSVEYTKSTHVLDQWIRARLAVTIEQITESLEGYDLVRGTRPIKDFIDDLSTWYVRRSRDRMKGSGDDARYALATLRFVLTEFAKIIAPVMPFVAEEVYQSVRTSNAAESVHLSTWPSAEKRKKEWKDLLEGMSAVRTYASEGLMLRQKANVKVRQPLASFSIPTELRPELTDLLAEELNVKEVIKNQDAVALDSALTPDLIKEGDERTYARAVAEARKEEGFSPRDTVTVHESPEGKYSAELSTGTVRFSLTLDAS